MNNQQLVIAFLTIFVKEVRRFTRIWVQTLLPSAITMTLYFVIFGNLIGSRIGQMDGLNYMEFIVPGLIMMAVITNSYSNVVSSFYSTKFHKNIEEMIVSPLPNWIILLGYVAGGMARGLAVGGIVTVLSRFFVQTQIEHIGITLATVLLTSMLFSIGGFINATFAKSFDDVTIIPNFVLTPLIYLGGVFYSIQMLPEFWQSVSHLNPILYMVNAFRYGILGVSDIQIEFALCIILLFNALLFYAALYLLNSGKGIRN